MTAKATADGGRRPDRIAGPGAVLAAAVLLLSSCGGDNAAPVTVPTTPTTIASSSTSRATTTAAATTTTRAAPTTAPTSTAPATTAATTSTSRASTTPVTTGAGDRCHSNELSLTLGAPDVAAGNVYVPLVLHNSSSRTCAVAGYPGVSLLDAAGAIIGTPATREGGPAPSVRLVPGAGASTAIHTVNQGIAPGGCWPVSTKVRVFPPNELDALDVAGAVTVCGNLFSITPLVAGTSGR